MSRSIKSRVLLHNSNFRNEDLVLVHSKFCQCSKTNGFYLRFYDPDIWYCFPSLKVANKFVRSDYLDKFSQYLIHD